MAKCKDSVKCGSMTENGIKVSSGTICLGGKEECLERRDRSKTVTGKGAILYPNSDSSMFLIA